MATAEPRKMQEESFVVKKVFGGKLRGRKQFIRRRFSLFVGNEKSMFKSRKNVGIYR